VTAETAATLQREAASGQAAPTSIANRIDSLDVLRGLAVLMIFVVNIKMMANGYNHYADRTLWEGPASGVIAYLHSVFVHGKFVTIFTALFGAGLALLLAREKPLPLAIVLKRLFWLGVFGAIHLIFIREGDIVLKYAIVGVPAIAFVRLEAKPLLLLGIVMQAALAVASITFPVSYENVPLLWQDGPSMHVEVERIMLGSLGDQISARLDSIRFYMFDLFILGRGWIDTLSVMIIGMGLLKNGFLAGKLPLRTYAVVGLGGLACAALLITLRVLDTASPLPDAVFEIAWPLHRFGGALFWSALTIAFVANGWQARGLAAVGRVAFTVYILQSVIGLLLFSSLGLGLFGQLSLVQLTLVTVCVLTLQIVASSLWLSRFQFGPLEWLWRSLTYGERQRMRRSSAP
jgi:uncharacterized protein